MSAHLTSIEFRNYKALKYYSIRLQDMNILVGPNNCGKSTIVSALRVLAAGLRKARSRNPERVRVGNMVQYGYSIDVGQLPISTENVHTDYAEIDSTIVFRLSNGNRLQLTFPQGGGCCLVPELERGMVRSPTTFKAQFPFTVAVVPVLGPLEHDEPLVESATVQRNLQTHLASRHFRNYWYYYPDDFDKFSDLLSRTWPGMEIERPEQADKILQMYCKERRITRELFWSGFGFQIWCQLLTHLSRASQDSLLVVDEPETYLHPDVQRQLLVILRGLGPSVIMATHSTEIMSEADASEIVLVDKLSRSAERLKDVTGIQMALDSVGSVQNVTLTRLAKHRRVVFVEGNDYSILLRFASLLGFNELAAATEMAPLSCGGFSGWTRVRDLAWGIHETLGTKLLIGLVLDRDYYPDQEIERVRSELHRLGFVHVHERKEIENYLLVPKVLERALKAAIRASNTGNSDTAISSLQIEELLEDITEKIKANIVGQYLARRIAVKPRSQDPATANTEALREFENKWVNLGTRLTLVPGKEVLRAVRTDFQKRYGVTLTDGRIAAAFRKEDVAEDMHKLISTLDVFRRQNI